MKYSVSMYSYSQLTSSGKKTLEECILLAKEQGFDGVEFVDIDPPEGMSEIEYAKILNAKKRDLKFQAIPSARIL